MDLRIINIRLNITEEGLRATLGNFNNYKVDEVFGTDNSRGPSGWPDDSFSAKSTVGDYLESGYCLGFMAGFVQALSALSLIHGFQECIPTEATNVQLARVFVRRLKHSQPNRRAALSTALLIIGQPHMGQLKPIEPQLQCVVECDLVFV
jgi:Ssp1 endopeptidase immunity protein Rap1a